MKKEDEAKKLSVVVIIYKVEKYLNKCIESIVNQTYKNLEIILVDDESPDNCPKMCDEWAKKDSRIKVLHKKNGGVSDARNKGMELVTGEYLAFVDADDFLSIDMYKTLVDLLEKNDADMSACRDSQFEDGTEPNFTIEDNVYLFKNSNEAYKNLFSNNNVILNNTWNKLCKKELYDGIIFPYGESAQDTSTTYKIIAKCKKVAVTPSKLYAYRQRRESAVHKCSRKFAIDCITAYNRQYNDLKDNKEIAEYLNIYMAKSIYLCFVQLAMVGDKELYDSELVLKEYKLLKKLVTFKNIKYYLEGRILKIKVLKLLLLISRKLFWKIRTRKSRRR